MKEKPSQGLLNLTRRVLERSFSDYTLDQLTAEDMEVLSDVVFHHIVKSEQERNMLTQLYGIGGGEPKPLGVIRAEHDWTKTQAQQYVDKAFQHLIDAAWADLYMTIVAIENDKEQS